MRDEALPVRLAATLLLLFVTCRHGAPNDPNDPTNSGPRPQPPALPTYSGERCPALTITPLGELALTRSFVSSGRARDVRIVVPEAYDDSRSHPVVFAWHWLRGSGSAMAGAMEIEAAASELGFIAVLPESARTEGGERVYSFEWPFLGVDEAAAEEERLFFEDVLACASEQLSIDAARVHGVGMSAGGLWLTRLSTTPVAHRFASVGILSGGLGEDPTPVATWSIEYQYQGHPFSALVAWGGPSDRFLLDFDSASRRYKEALLARGHLVVACEHEEGHTLPPFQAAEGRSRFHALWRFLLDHDHASTGRRSPYASEGLPDVFPPWCERVTH